MFYVNCCTNKNEIKIENVKIYIKMSKVKFQEKFKEKEDT